MTRFPLRSAFAAALVVGAFFAIFHGLVNRTREPVVCHGCGLPVPVSVAKVSIRKGTSGTVIESRRLYSAKAIQRSEFVKGMLMVPLGVRGEVTIRTIPAGAFLTTADFALRGPIYYPRGYPKKVPASQIPAKMSLWIGPPRDGLDLALAPGVWVDGSTADAAIDEHVANGTLVGYCRSIGAFQAHNPDVRFATHCWRK